ncbi:MAG: 7-cyano-7-deazaguanine synthase QueC [Candidatus Aminicenantaceae bacterium]
MKKLVVLFSGGIDSTTTLYWAVKKSKSVHALTFDYGQQNRIEIDMAAKITSKLNVSHHIIKFDMAQIGGSSLTEEEIPVPEYKQAEELGKEIPTTYVPFRNGIFLSIAAAWSEARNLMDIACGFNIVDSPHYPDTRKGFVKAMENAINKGIRAFQNKSKMRIHIPFINRSKSEIIKKGLSIGADYSYSLSCYNGKEIPCMKCSSCLFRKKAWDETGYEDHLIIRLKKEGKI